LGVRKFSGGGFGGGGGENLKKSLKDSEILGEENGFFDARRWIRNVKVLGRKEFASVQFSVFREEVAGLLGSGSDQGGRYPIAQPMRG
jgi:hypothetical protein